MKPVKLRTKLTLIYALIFGLLLTGTGAWFYNLFAYQIDKDLEEELSERAIALRNYLYINGDRVELIYNTNDPDEAYFVNLAARYYQIYDAESGKLLARSREIEAIGFQYSADEVKEVIQGPRLAALKTDQLSLLVRNDLIETIDRRKCLLQVGVSLEPRNNAVSRLLQVGIWLIPVGLILAISLGWWAAGRALHPMLVLSSAAREITVSRLDKRLPIRGTGDELDQLASAFNEVLDRLDKAMQQMKEFTSNISHELRTPLTVLRGEAEVALSKASTEKDYRRVLESQLEEFEKLSRMIDQMLILARAEAGQIKLMREVVCLSDLGKIVAEQLEPVAANKGLSLVSSSNGKVDVIGDRGWLERMLLNLLDNAIKFTPAGGHINVTIASSNNQAFVEVRDDGIGISSEALPHIFERFYREDPSRSSELEGTGLGLSLVQWIVQQHHGRVSVASKPGQGSVFRVELPLAPDDVC